MTKCFGLMASEEKNMIKVPMCYANYCKDDPTCQKCTVKEGCMKIPHPKEPEWCNPE